MEDKQVSPQDEGSLEALETKPINEASASGTVPEAPHFGSSGLKFLPSRRLLLIAGLIFLLIIGSVVVALVMKPARKPSTTLIVNTQSLDNGTLNKLTTQTGNTGQVTQQLTISPNTLFKNDVAVQGSATVGKDLFVKGTSTLQGAVTTGSSLSVGGNLSVSGLITAASLSVGSVSISTINLSSNLNLGGHIVPTGTTPSIKANVSASGGSATISGNDTAGTVTINVGNGPLLAGELAIITFHSPFATTPKVQLTPVNAAASALNYYVSQSPTFFSVETSTTPTAGTSYTFNYFVTQ